MARPVILTIVAVIASYLSFGLMVAATGQLLSFLWGSQWSTLPVSLAADLFSQCFYAAAAGYLCRRIARDCYPAAVAGLISTGLVVGTISLVTSWGSEPRWYGIGLLASYAPCVWMGSAAGRRK